MRKGELVKRAAARLRETRARKPVTIPSHTFHISDDIGNTSDFKVKPSKGLSSYNSDDVAVILDALMYVAQEAVENGEEIVLHGFASLRVKHYKSYMMKDPNTGEMVEVTERYVPKFEPGNELRRAAKSYGISLRDRVGNASFVYQDEVDKYDAYHADEDDDDAT